MNKAFELWQWENEPSAETPLSAEFLNRLNNGLNEVDNRVINQNTTKLDVTTANTMVKDVTFDSASGIFTITKLNGSTVKIDTKLEKLAVNFEFDSSTQTLNIILEDGTTQTVDLSTLITQYEFGESDTIVLTVGSNGKVVANIKFGSITGNMLEPNYLANVTTQADSAKASAETATAQADRATTEADRAEDAADRAEAVSEVDIATVEKAGIVKPDGTTITVDADGTIHGSSQGVSQEDFNKVIDGTTTVGNADKLDGNSAEYFAPFEELNNHIYPIVRIASDDDLSQLDDLHTNAKNDECYERRLYFSYANAFFSGGVVMLEGCRQTATHGYQIAKKWGNIVAIRSIVGGTWGEWIKFATTTDLANYLPLSGGMVRNLTVGRHSILHVPGVVFDMEGTVYGYLGVSATYGLVYWDKDLNNFNVLHTGNKPSGTYTGNGDATARTIDVGGIGRWLGIASANSTVFVNNLGGFGIDRSTRAITNFTQNELKYQSGVLTMATSSELVNFNTRGYLYDVL